MSKATEAAISTSPSIEEAIKGAPDATFRAIATSEYKRITGWVGPHASLDSASILDFGCGQGVAAASFALRHPGSSVAGYDVSRVSIEDVAKLYKRQTGLALPSNVKYISGDLSAVKPQSLDLIYAWSVIEHIDIDALPKLLRLFRDKLKKTGLLFVYSDPLYYSPNGSHLYRYLKSPWHHLLMSLDQMRTSVITEKATDTATREWQQFLGLNRFTAGEVLTNIGAAGFDVIKQQQFKTNLEPPERLLRIFNPEVLTTSAIQILAKPN
jgi:SAM-dependent methyltransferase